MNSKCATRRTIGWKLRSVLAVLLAFTLAPAANAGPRDQAKQMHDRLVGVPPTADTLTAMSNLIAANNPRAAADLAMANPLFYNSTLKNWITPWTNEAQTVYAPLNDYTATAIGIIRDDRPFTDILSADLVYVGGTGVVNNDYSHTDNLHYMELEAGRHDLSSQSVLVPMAQSALPGAMISAEDAAGVLTTRAAGEAYLSAGTNRRMWRFTAINYLCRDMEELNDITRPADRVRQDVTRSPGGDSRIFHNTCVGCHSGMDPLVGAFAYFEWDPEQARVIYTPNQVQGKYLINGGTFAFGHVTTDDSWENFWRVGPNSILGWRGNTSGGNGPKSLGTEVANSRAFSECQVRKVFEQVCLRPPANPAERAEVQRIANVFEGQSYSMKTVFAEVATTCMGQ